MKILKKALSLLIAVISCFTLLTACSGGGNDNKATEAKFESSDSKYELTLNDKGKAYVTEKGKTEKIMSGTCNVREENSALTLVFDGEAVEVSNERYTISFTLKDETKGVNAFFRLHRGKMLKGLGVNGVILDTGANDPENPSQDEAPGTAMGFSLGTSFLVWNSGKIEIKIIKVQANFNYTFDKTNGLKFTPTEYQTSTFGMIEVESFTDGEYVIHFNIKARLPFGLSSDQKANIKKADLEAALDF